MELVRRVASDKQLTLLFCEHDMSVVFGTARTVTVMHMGQVLVEGSSEQVLGNPDVQKVYLGELEASAGARGRAAGRPDMGSPMSCSD